MKKLRVGIVDYGVGNVSSIRHTLLRLGYRCRVADTTEALNETELLLLPGVGAFPHTVENLRDRGLFEYIQEKAKIGLPILGVCVGMQLFANESEEMGLTRGLGLIPGRVHPFPNLNSHIGWNNLNNIRQNDILHDFEGYSFYFNHSYIFSTPKKYQVATARNIGDKKSFPVIVRNDNVVGLQFHAEKSQQAGRDLLSKIIETLCNA